MRMRIVVEMGHGLAPGPPWTRLEAYYVRFGPATRDRAPPPSVMVASYLTGGAITMHQGLAYLGGRYH